MGLIGTIKDALDSPTNARSSQPKGSFWCHDCGERVPESDVEGDTPPTCPECGDAMEYERSVGTANCAC